MDVQPPVVLQCPFLLLDVREKDDYDQCHIIGALNYPAAMLSRSFNYFTKEILSYVCEYSSNGWIIEVMWALS